MKFENATFNPHASYNPKTSTFTCDRDGTYVFYVTLMPHKKYRYNQHQYKIIQDQHALTHGFTRWGSMPYLLSSGVSLVAGCGWAVKPYTAIHSNGGPGILSASISLEDTKLSEE